MTHTPQWLVVTDARTATMFRCRATSGGEWNLESVGSLTNSHEREHQRGRPSELSGQGLGAVSHGAPHMASPGHGEEEELHRFALEIAGDSAWLPRMIRDQKAERVHVFAPASFLGALRTVMAAKNNHGGGTLTETTTFLEGELARLRPGQLATHPKVLAALGHAAR